MAKSQVSQANWRVSVGSVLLALSLTPAYQLQAQGDSVPPATVNDLTVIGNGASSVTLRWTAPGDDGAQGTSDRYDVRYAMSPIVSEGDFTAAMQASGEPNPKGAGSTETFPVTGLAKARIYYFSVKAIDEANNSGDPSNEASGNTHFEGYGYATTGGSGDDVYHVTSLANSGPGTLRDGVLTNRSGPRTIVFDVGGTITLLSDIKVERESSTDLLTIDGSTAPDPGITVRKQACQSGLNSCPKGDSCIRDGEFRIGTGGPPPTEEVILTYLRFRGNYELGWGGCDEQAAATLATQYALRNIVLDHLTIRNGSDASPDLWTDIFDASDLTYSHNVIAFSYHPFTISDDKSGRGSRDNVSIHHNVLARSGERLPQVRGATTDFDFRNNLIFDWGATGGGAYGMRIRNDGGSSATVQVKANVVNNFFIPGNGSPQRAFYYGSGPGSESEDGGPGGCPAQGTVVTTTYMAELWVSGNEFPDEVCDRYSTVGGERPVPAAARVPTDRAVDLLGSVLPSVGTHYRLADEQALLDEIAGELPVGGPLFSDGFESGDVSAWSTMWP